MLSLKVPTPSSVPALPLAESGVPLSLGRYQPFAKLGSGGQAEVFLAVARGQMGFNKLAVVKRLRAHTTNWPEHVSMFLDEARLAARLTHRNVVHTYEVGELDGVYFLAMEYLEGQPLHELLRAGADVVPEVWVRIVADALAGLQYAHELRDYDGTPLNVVHRDISPQNIFVTYQGEVKLVDFGVAKAEVNDTQTASGIFKGKLSYMAPEQIAGDADRRCDVFAMGIVLWEALAGRRLYGVERSKVDVLRQLMNDPVPSLVEARPSVDASLAAIVARALEKDPSARYQTAAEMREALEQWLRSVGRVVLEREVSDIVVARFGETREAIARQTQAAMEGLRATSSGAIRAMAATTASFPFIGVTSVSTTPASAGESLVESAPGTKSESTPRAASVSHAPLRRSLGWWGIVLGPVLLVGVATWWVRAAPTTRHAPPSRAAEARASAMIELASDPPEARIEWNGGALGHTPARVELPPGAQTLVLYREGYDPATLVVDVAPGVSTARNVTLRRRTDETQGAPVVTISSLAAAPPVLAAGASRRAAKVVPSAAPPAASRIKILGEDEPQRTISILPE